MRPHTVMKWRRAAIPMFLLCTVLFLGAASGGKRRDGDIGAGEREPGRKALVLEDVRLKPGVVMRASSDRFLLEATISEGDVRGGVPEPAGGPRPPSRFALSQNYPNPFNPATTIAFEIPGETGEDRAVSLQVYDIRGRHVRSLVDCELEPGVHRVVWDGRDERGVRVSSGIYFSVLECGRRSSTRKMIVFE
jgi:hypothetical protein